MNALNRIFLKAKHWQLFILIFILPCIAGVAFIVAALPDPATTANPQEYIARLTENNVWFSTPY